MSDRFDIIDPKKVELQKLVKAIPWEKFIDYGWVKIKISNGKPTLITVEQSDRIE